MSYKRQCVLRETETHDYILYNKYITILSNKQIYYKGVDSQDYGG